MAKIFYLMGKSSSGKDTIYKELRERIPELKTIVSYTTRPIREGEREGVEYHFTDEKGFQELLSAGKVIEHREYHTYYGLWRYFTVDDGQFDMDSKKAYLMIGTLESYRSMQQYFGPESMEAILIELDDGIRLQRALDREKNQALPKYEEMCRRFLADSQDFSSEKIQAAGIHKCFHNLELEQCLREITDWIRGSI